MTNKENCFNEIISDIFRFCNTCFKPIDKNEPYIIAYKNGHPAYFCRDHIHDAEYYLDWFLEFAEVKHFRAETDENNFV